jgi:hypothetical protein
MVAGGQLREVHEPEPTAQLSVLAGERHQFRDPAEDQLDGPVHRGHEVLQGVAHLLDFGYSDFRVETCAALALRRQERRGQGGDRVAREMTTDTARSLECNRS